MTQNTSRPEGHDAPHRVVVIGTGFGGLFASRKLAKAPVDPATFDSLRGAQMTGA